MGFVDGFYCDCAWLLEDKIADDKHICQGIIRFMKCGEISHWDRCLGMSNSIPFQ